MSPSWEPDSALTDAVEPSPNHGPRPEGRTPDLLLLHYTGMAHETEALARLCDTAAEVSSHYLVLGNGGIVQLVPESRRAWHAGRGGWAGESDVNACSIGIEIANPGHDGGLPPYPDAQIEGVIALCGDIMARHAIRPERVLGHSDIAPDRKLDPGERFPWGRLAQAGIGHWVEPAAISHDARHPAPDRPEARTLQQALARYGYAIPITGSYDPTTRSVLAAFQRHFRPQRVDGIADHSTWATLDRLLRARPGG